MIGWSTHLGTAEGRQAASDAFRSVHQRYPNSRHALEARFRSILTLMQPDNVEEWQPMLDAFRRAHPDSVHARMLDSHADAIQKLIRMNAEHRQRSGDY